MFYKLCCSQRYRQNTNSYCVSRNMSSLYLLFYFSLQITAFFKPRKVIHQHTLLRLNIISHNDITSDKEISYKRFIDTKNLFTSLASAVLLPKVVQAVGYQVSSLYYCLCHLSLVLVSISFNTKKTVCLLPPVIFLFLVFILILIVIFNILYIYIYLKAAPSAFSPNQFLYSPPLLPQSALLNSLPFSDLLVAELQAYLECKLLSTAAISKYFICAFC